MLFEGDKSNVAIAFALHHLLIPSSIGWGAKRWRPSVKSSKGTMLQIVASKSSIPLKLKFRKTQRNLRSIEDHPIIFGVGEEEDIEEYIVVMGNIFYSFENFIDALDACFKCHVIFNRNFPPESLKFWTFLNLIFYKIETKNDDTSSVIPITELLK